MKLKPPPPPPLLFIGLCDGTGAGPTDSPAKSSIIDLLLVDGTGAGLLVTPPKFIPENILSLAGGAGGAGWEGGGKSSLRKSKLLEIAVDEEDKGAGGGT